MGKKIIISSLFLAASLGLTGIVLPNSFHLSPFEQAASGHKYLNKTSASLLKSRLPESITINADEKTEVFQTAAINAFLSPNPTSKEPKSKNSIISYFFEQTSSRNPLAAYDSRDSVSGLGFSEDKIGEYIKKLEGEVNREFANAKLTLEEGIATEFVPDRVGLNLDVAKSAGGSKTCAS